LKHGFFLLGSTYHLGDRLQLLLKNLKYLSMSLTLLFNELGLSDYQATIEAQGFEVPDDLKEVRFEIKNHFTMAFENTLSSS
jgi:hypothetical protein